MIMREINKIIIHCTATKEGQAVSVAEVTKWHKAKGYNTIGYHYLIGLNGEIWEGRKEGIVGAHTEGYNANSIGICYVGGLDDNSKPKDTRTAAQKESLLKLVNELKARFPQATIHGHKEFANKACPCFEVKKEFFN
jgi:N-acetylmuramoyl-L-alanine amidase